MNARQRKLPAWRAGIAFAGVSGLLIGMTACAAPDSSGTDEGEEITLTVSVFTDFGYSEEMIAEFEAENPGITVVQDQAATGGGAAERDNILTKLAAGSGLADVVAISNDWMPQMLQYPDKFVDLTSDDVDGRWLDWVAGAATDAEGRLIGYGTDIGPQAICYRTDLFAEAGLPTDREEVAALLEGDWDHYFGIGEDFFAETGVAWFDAPIVTYNSLIGQIDYAYEDADGTVVAATNPETKNAFFTAIEASLATGADLKEFSDDWYAGMASGAFATIACPSWMLGMVEGNAPDTTTWDVANVFPEGGGNWGGSYLTVPTQSPHPEEAKELAAWLTAPEQQVQAFQNIGAFPSQVDAYSDPVLIDYANEYFNGAPTGTIFSDRASATDISTTKGPNNFAIAQILEAGVTRAAIDRSQTAEEAWEQVVSELESANLN
ncbi:ABC transporter substrate-binding protein [Microbacterium sp. HJ5]